MNMPHEEAERPEPQDERLHAMLRLSSDWYWETDADGRFVYAIQGDEPAAGAGARQLTGRLPDEAVRDRSQPGWIAYQRAVAERAPFMALKFALQWPGHLEMFVSVSGEPRFEGGRFAGYRGISRDVSGRVRLAAQVDVLADECHAIFEHSPDAIVVIGRDGCNIRANPAFRRVLGYAEGDALGRHFREFLTEADSARVAAAIADMMARGTNVTEFDTCCIRRDGTAVAMSWSAFYSSRYERVFAFGRDMTEHKLAAQRMEHLALHDPLTGLPNRAFLKMRLGEMLATAPREETNAVMLIDLDRFKAVNDSMGHKAGDLLLCEVGRRLRAAMRPADTIVRLGGDEFVIVAHCRNGADSACKIAHKILALLATPVTIEGQSVAAGGSIGISLFPQHGTSKEELLQKADIAMYRAKAQGRSCARMYSSEMGDSVRLRRQREVALHGALAQQQFVLHYQPRVDLHTGEIMAVEALIRWTHPALGSIAPDVFIPLAEELGIIDAIGAWVLERACVEILALPQRAGANLRLSVNLSAAQFRNPDLAEQVASILERTAFPAERLEVELTETAFIEDAAQTAAIIERLRQMGLTIAIDDFGTGHAGLSYIRDFDIGIVKLDKSFLLADSRYRSRMAFMKAAVQLAHALDLKVVAEGVENEGMLALLRVANCDEGQGYLFAKPMAIGALRAFLDR